MITGPQCRAARALVELTRERLALMAKIDSSIIEMFERKLGTPGEDDLLALQSALEAAGAVFIPEDTGGIGVRLKFNRSETKRIAILEGEGGIVGHDDVQ